MPLFLESRYKALIVNKLQQAWGFPYGGALTQSHNTLIFRKLWLFYFPFPRKIPVFFRKTTQNNKTTLLLRRSYILCLCCDCFQAV